jgi:benzoate membrane transport protein
LFFTAGLLPDAPVRSYDGARNTRFAAARLSDNRPMSLENFQRPLPGLGRMASDFGGVYFANAVVAFIFAASGPVAIILSVGARGGLSESDISSWIFGAFFLNSLISLLFCWLYRQPLVFFWSIPGAVLVGPALGHLSFAEVIGAFYVTGLLMGVLGFTGWVRRAMQSVPMPIVMGMVAGVFLRFGLDLVYSVRDDFRLAAPMTLAFVVLTALPRLARLLPPVIGALIVGALVIALTGGFDAKDAQIFAMVKPNLYHVVFSWRAMIELVVPLAITVLVVQNGQGFAVLGAAGHKPPINAITVACGAGSMISGLVGAVSSCLTGPVNAIISASGARERQYIAGMLVALFGLLFGLYASVFTRLLLATPKAFIATLAGLAMLRVLQTAFTVSFRDRFALGALVTFLVTVADVAIFNIGAPFWGLVFGFAVSWLIEREDFRSLRGQA